MFVPPNILAPIAALATLIAAIFGISLSGGASAEGTKPGGETSSSVPGGAGSSDKGSGEEGLVVSVPDSAKRVTNPNEVRAIIADGLVGVQHSSMHFTGKGNPVINIHGGDGCNTFGGVMSIGLDGTFIRLPGTSGTLKACTPAIDKDFHAVMRTGAGIYRDGNNYWVGFQNHAIKFTRKG